jgi:hypothetical protein
VALSSQEGSITMTDRPSSSSRDSQRDRPPNRSDQDLSHQSARDRHVTTWSQHSDQQASTSSSLNNDKRLKGKYREQRQRNYIHDELQHRFNVSLSEMESYLKNIEPNKEERDKILEIYEQDFQELTKKGKGETCVEIFEEQMRKLQPDKYDDEKQVEIDKKLGYLLKNKKEELINIRMSVLKFLEEKIKNETDKKDAFLGWNHALDEYCTTANTLVTSSVYQNVINDLHLCYEIDRNKIAANEKNNIYTGDNSNIYKSINRINKSLYTEQEMAQMHRQENEEQERQNFQDLLVQEQEHSMLRQHLNAIIPDNDETEVQRVLLQSREESEMQRVLLQSREESEMQHVLLQSREETEMQHVLLQSREETEMQHVLLQSLDQLSNQGFNNHGQLEHDHRPQHQTQQRPEQRFEEIDLSHMTSPQIIDCSEVLRQQMQRMFIHIGNRISRHNRSRSSNSS